MRKLKKGIVKYVTVAALFIYLTSRCLAEIITGQTYKAAFSFDIPDGVTLKSDTHQFVFSWDNGPPHGMASFRMMRSMSIASPKVIKAYADLLDVQYEEWLGTDDPTAKVQQKQRAEIALGPFKGLQSEYVVQHTFGGNQKSTCMSYFLTMHDGMVGWEGRSYPLFWSTNDIAVVHRILKTAKPIVLAPATDGGNMILNQRREERRPQTSTSSALHGDDKGGEPPARTVDAAASCRNSLRQIDAAKEQVAMEKHLESGATVTIDDMKKYWRHAPDGIVAPCPLGGAHTINPVGMDPTCSVPGQALR